MPELPEVQQVATGLASILVGNRIHKVRIYSHWRQIPDDLRERAYRQTVQTVIRHGKYLFLVFDREVLMVHLGMSGSFRVVPITEHRGKHDHYALLLRRAGAKVIYNDPRQFGRMKWATEARKSLLDPDEHGLPEFSLGIDGLHPDLNPKRSTSGPLWNQWFWGTLLATTPIKVALLQQSRVAGIGNIYASEILFASEIHPMRPVSEITRYQRRKVAKYTWRILRSAVKYGGTTIKGSNKYADPYQQPGEFSQYLAVYGREGERCQRCRSRIVKERVRGRSTYYCPRCQPVN